MSLQNQRSQYDIGIITDFCYPGGTSSSVVEEAYAHHASGLRTAFIHVRSPHLKRSNTFNPKVVQCVQSGVADLIGPDQPVDVDLLVFRHPRVFTQSPSSKCLIGATHAVMVVNQVHRDGTALTSYYDPVEIQKNIFNWCGLKPIWTPIGPLVRDSMASYHPAIGQTEWDWYNIISVDDWRSERPRLSEPRPVIGRHSRPHRKKWPQHAEQILAAYPSDPSFTVRILGGAEFPQKVLGQLPSNWDVYPFRSMNPRKFLRLVDFFCYFHHPDLVEAFGRSILEALSSGCVVIVPHHFERLFGESCVYCKPEEVQGVVRSFSTSPHLYESQVVKSSEYVREKFSYETHTQRLYQHFGIKSSGVSPAVNKKRPILLLTRGNDLVHKLHCLSSELQVLGLRSVLGLPKRLAPAALALDHVVECPSGLDFKNGQTDSSASTWLVRLIDRYDPKVIVSDSELSSEVLHKIRRIDPGMGLIYLHPGGGATSDWDLCFPYSVDNQKLISEIQKYYGL